jgi:hypothetical protein
MDASLVGCVASGGSPERPFCFNAVDVLALQTSAR